MKNILICNLDLTYSIIESFENLEKKIDNIIELNKYQYNTFNNTIRFEDLNCNESYNIIVSKNYNVEHIENILSNMNINYKLVMFKDFLLDTLKNNSEIILKPKKLRFEACTRCQLNCLTCYMRKNNYGIAKKGHLKFNDFKNFIDKYDFIKSIELSNSGEVFLNPEINEILEYAFNKNIDIFLSNGVNFNTVSDKTIENLVKFGVKTLNISLDGASNEIYSIYRRNGNFDKVIEHIKKLNYYKKIYNSETPYVSWQYVILEHNLCDIKNAIKLSKELNTNINFKRDWNNYIPKNKEEITKLTGLTFEDYEESEFCDNECLQSIISPQINYDGNVLACSYNYWNTIGKNVFENNYIEVLNQEEYRDALYMKLGDKVDKKYNNACSECFVTKQQINKGKYLDL